jgi:hypothetical protein
MMTCVDAIVLILQRYYEHQIFGDANDVRSLYDTPINSEDSVAHRLAAIGYSISLTPEIIEALMSPRHFSRFYYLFIDYAFDDRCMDLVHKFARGHKLQARRGESPGLEQREELTVQALKAESFRFHHIRQYFFTPIWASIIRSPHADESLKTEVAERILNLTVPIEGIILGGTGCFVVLELESKRDDFRAEYERLLSDRGHAAAYIGTVRSNYDQLKSKVTFPMFSSYWRQRIVRGV